MIPFNSKVLVAVSAVFIMGVAVSAETHDGAGVTRSISVTGQGEASGKPDQAEVSAGVQVIAATAVEASQENQAVLAQIMEALEQQGIADEDIQTENYSISAVQDYDKSGKERITGYRVTNVVRFMVRDISKTGDVLAAVTNAGANSINGINFSVADTAALELKAREAAMTEARTTAESLAMLAGVQLGEVQAISSFAAPTGPNPYIGFRTLEMDARAAAPAPGIAPGQQSVSVQVSVTYAIR